MLFGKEARQSLVIGVSLMYRAVCSTLSPKGRNVGLSRQFGAPIIVHDGVTCADKVFDGNPYINMGINLVREAARKTNEEAGDGTTTSTLIAYEVIARGLKLIDAGVNPMVLRKQIYEALGDCIERLNKLAKPAKTQKALEQVATISSSDEGLAKMVAEAVHRGGEDGLIAVEEAFGSETYVTYTEGLTVDKGYITPYFITNTKRQEAVIDKPVIALIDKEITTQREIVPLLETIIPFSKNIVIIGEVKGEALSILVQNKMKGVINAVVVEPPGYGSNTKDYLEDLAVATGGRVFSKELGLDIQAFANTFDAGWLGSAEKVIVNKKTCMIVKGDGEKKEVKKQIEKLKTLKGKADSLAEKERLEERIAKLTGGVAVIKVGAKTEVEGREKLERAKDAVGAAQAALKEGVVPGSGVAFIHLIKAIKEDNDGARLLKEVLLQPARKVMLNSGESGKKFLWIFPSPIDKIIKKIRQDKDLTLGYEVNSGQLVNLIKEGILDPVKVIRLTLENGIGVATSILTTDTLIETDSPVQQLVPQNG